VKVRSAYIQTNNIIGFMRHINKQEKKLFHTKDDIYNDNDIVLKIILNVKE